MTVRMRSWLARTTGFGDGDNLSLLENNYTEADSAAASSGSPVGMAATGRIASRAHPSLIVPIDVLTHAFSFLDTADKCHCALTCKMWRNVAYEPMLWPRLNLSHMYSLVNDQMLARLLAGTGADVSPVSGIVGSVSVTTEATDIRLDAACSRFDELAELNLDNCIAITDKTLKFIASARFARSLKSLRVTNCFNLNPSSVISSVSQLPSLIHIELFGVITSSQPGSRNVAALMRQQEQLPLIDDNGDMVEAVSEQIATIHTALAMATALKRCRPWLDLGFFWLQILSITGRRDPLLFMSYFEQQQGIIRDFRTCAARFRTPEEWVRYVQSLESDELKSEDLEVKVDDGAEEGDEEAESESSRMSHSSDDKPGKSSSSARESLLGDSTDAKVDGAMNDTGAIRMAKRKRSKKESSSAKLSAKDLGTQLEINRTHMFASAATATTAAAMSASSMSPPSPLKKSGGDLFDNPELVMQSAATAHSHQISFGMRTDTAMADRSLVGVGIVEGLMAKESDSKSDELLGYVPSTERVSATEDLQRLFESNGVLLPPILEESKCRAEGVAGTGTFCHGQVTGRIIYSTRSHAHVCGRFPDEVVFYCENHSAMFDEMQELFICRICERRFREASMEVRFSGKSVCRYCFDQKKLEDKSIWMSLFPDYDATIRCAAEAAAAATYGVEDQAAANDAREAEDLAAGGVRAAEVVRRRRRRRRRVESGRRGRNKDGDICDFGHVCEKTLTVCDRRSLPPSLKTYGVVKCAVSYQMRQRVAVQRSAAAPMSSASRSQSPRRELGVISSALSASSSASSSPAAARGRAASPPRAVALRTIGIIPQRGRRRGGRRRRADGSEEERRSLLSASVSESEDDSHSSEDDGVIHTRVRHLRRAAAAAAPASEERGAAEMASAASSPTAEARLFLHETRTSLRAFWELNERDVSAMMDSIETCLRKAEADGNTRAVLVYSDKKKRDGRSVSGEGLGDDARGRRHYGRYIEVLADKGLVIDGADGEDFIALSNAAWQHFYSMFLPVLLCMAATLHFLTALKTYTWRAKRSSVTSEAYYLPDKPKSKDSSDDVYLFVALGAFALLIVVAYAAYKFQRQCEKLFRTFLVVDIAMIILIGGAILMLVTLSNLNVTFDMFSFVLLLWNYAICSTIAFYKPVCDNAHKVFLVLLNLVMAVMIASALQSYSMFLILLLAGADAFAMYNVRFARVFSPFLLPTNMLLPPNATPRIFYSVYGLRVRATDFMFYGLMTSLLADYFTFYSLSLLCFTILAMYTLCVFFLPYFSYQRIRPLPIVFAAVFVVVFVDSRVVKHFMHSQVFNTFGVP